MTIKEEVVKPSRYIIEVKGRDIECRHIIEALINRNKDKINPVSSPYFTDAFEYLFRLYDKHDDPETDIRKAIQKLIFLLEAETGKKTELKDIVKVKKSPAQRAREQLLADFIGLPEFPHIRSDD